MSDAGGVLIRVATRASRLALWQATHVRELLRAAHPELRIELAPMTTQGDRLSGASFTRMGGKGLFIKDLETAILDGRADVAVHSMKDVPAEMPAAFSIAAVLARADPRDAFLSNRYASLAALPAGEPLGSSSLRRQSQLRRLRPDLSVQPLRGNVDTRVKRLDEGRFAAIVLAAAGLERLGLAGRISERLSPDICLPAIGQGIIGIECRAGDRKLAGLLAALEHPPTRACLTAERIFAAALGGSCQSPIGGYAVINGDELLLRGYIGMPDGSRAVSGERGGAAADCECIGETLAAELLAAGGAEILRDCDAL
ncbi:MAG: hydroxymethylbilane synthase [Gammaproteobacteria bacterium]